MERVGTVHISDDLGEVRTMLAERVQEWTRTWLEQGREQGLREGETRFLRRLLEGRFGQLPESLAQRIEAASTEDLVVWGERVLSAQTLEEVFGGE